MTTVRAERRPSRIHHIGIVVTDRDRSLDFLGSMFGAEGWVVPDEDAAELTKSTPGFRLAIGFLGLDNLLLEIIQPLDPSSPHAEFLVERGEGLHHVGFEAPVLEEPVARFVDSGCAIAYDRSSPDSPMRSAHLGGGPLDGTVVEVMEQSPASDRFWDFVRGTTRTGK